MDAAQTTDAVGAALERDTREKHVALDGSTHLLPPGLLPCSCLCCGKEMGLETVHRHVPRRSGDPVEVLGRQYAGEIREVVYGGCGCGNQQRTILGVEEAGPPPPRFPCDACGKETRSNSHLGWRHCSSAACGRESFMPDEDELRLTQAKMESLEANVAWLTSRVDLLTAQLRKHIKE